MKKLIMLVCAMGCFYLLGAEKKAEEKIRDFYPAAALKNHVLIVNVGEAIPSAIFPEVSRFAASRVQLNIWTNSIKESIVLDLVKDPSCMQKRFGEKTIVCVFLEKNEKGASFLQAPGSWAMVNVRGLDKDHPDAKTLRDRYAKMILKGLSHACGGGATLDPQCSLFYGSFTLQGMDKTKIMISPMSYFPMLETLRAIGGDEILSPILENE